MGCRCKERAEALRKAAAAGLKFNGRDVAHELGLVGRTLREDV
jgi:hypothetical protein